MPTMSRLTPTFCGSRPNKQARVISDPHFHEVQPYSEISDIHPQKMLATKHGWRQLHNDKCAWTGKSEKYMAERSARVHATRDWHKAHVHRCTIIERHQSQTFKGLSDSELKATPSQSIGAILADDRCAGATTKVSCQSRLSDSTGGCTQARRLPPQYARSPSCRSANDPKSSDHEAVTSATCPKQRPQCSQCSNSMVMAAARTKPVKKPTAKKGREQRPQRSWSDWLLRALSLSQPKQLSSERYRHARTA